MMQWVFSVLFSALVWLSVTRFSFSSDLAGVIVFLSMTLPPPLEALIIQAACLLQAQL